MVLWKLLATYTKGLQHSIHKHNSNNCFEWNTINKRHEIYWAALSGSLHSFFIHSILKIVKYYVVPDQFYFWFDRKLLMFIHIFVPGILNFKQSYHQNVQKVFLLGWKVTLSNKTTNITKNCALTGINWISFPLLHVTNSNVICIFAIF